MKNHVKNRPKTLQTQFNAREESDNNNNNNINADINKQTNKQPNFNNNNRKISFIITTFTKQVLL